MTVLELIEAARNFKPTEAQMAERLKMYKELNAEFKRKAEQGRVTEEMLNRVYSL